MAPRSGGREARPGRPAREGGLTPADRSAIRSDLAALRKPGVLRDVGSISSTFGPGGIVSPNGTTAVAVVDIDSTAIAVVKPAVETIRDLVEKSPPPGLTVHVTGAADDGPASSRAPD